MVESLREPVEILPRPLEPRVDPERLLEVPPRLFMVPSLRSRTALPIVTLKRAATRTARSRDGSSNQPSGVRPTSARLAVRASIHPLRRLEIPWCGDVHRAPCRTSAA